MRLDVLQYLKSVFGAVSNHELWVVGLIVLAILAYSWAPKMGEAVGLMLAGQEPPDTGEPGSE